MQKTPLVDTTVELVIPGADQGILPVPLLPISIEFPYGAQGEGGEVSEGVSSQGVAVVQQHFTYVESEAARLLPFWVVELL